ncbi:hypothetical protein BJ875DRAFT_532339 [Amylocarpus encephaloides]|uniref:Transcription initiation factor TFIID subunit 4 n=1 Tax=Amylocarpus encephaloides TaxID=45428 RepID=A0A9P8C939_9HELO|nr:hypothetical protein BJ875DRAFT_532339 [Amylocarpus encephaloides]
MAQPQPPPHQQYQMSQRQFSPNEAPPPSPGTPQQFPFPAAKRQRLSPNPPSQPGSPYTQSPYAMSPGASGPSSASASPHFANVQLPNVYNTPYSNGHTTPTINHPQSQPQSQNQVHFQNPQSNPLNLPNQIQGPSNYNNNYNMIPQGAGMMGPPSKPPEKPKEDAFDGLDILGGTGINIHAEEQYLLNNSFGNNSFGPQGASADTSFHGASHGYSQYPPGNAASFYGAGPANVVAEVVDAGQDEYHRQRAENAWHEAANRLAVSRMREIHFPFLNIVNLQRRAEKIAREHGLSLNVDRHGKMGVFHLPANFQNPAANVNTVVGPTNTTFTATSGSFLQPDTQLADQVALLSLATRHRLRGLYEDAGRLAKGRQTGSHGIVPEEWADVASPLDLNRSTIVPENGVRSGWESAVSPQSLSRKRSFSTANKLPTPVSDGTKTPTEGPKLTNTVVVALRGIATRERDLEETRLRKRQNRTAGGDSASRQGSVAPGTPGSIAPEEKPPTKKEQTKKAQLKVNEAASHLAANQTTSAFLGGGGGLFGKKKKYSWMTGGGGGAGSASGASTPGRLMTQGLIGTPPAGPPVPEKLTADGVRRVGAWREDQDKGKGVQLRDWILVLEEDGREKHALQKAYVLLDDCGPK